MTSTPRRLLVALAVSVLFHAVPFLAGLWPKPVSTPSAPLLHAELRTPPPPKPRFEQPELSLPKPPKPTQNIPALPRLSNDIAPRKQAGSWTDEVKKQFRKLEEASEFYPREAISQGLQGQALVLLILDETGSVVATRIEESSGHPILDAAALRAVRSLRSLPVDAPRETLLPVRFRLK